VYYCIVDLTSIVDWDERKNCWEIYQDIVGKQTERALRWCTKYASRLRRLNSPFEFHLRIQDAVELVRKRNYLEAISYAQKHLTPLAMQYQSPEEKEQAIHQVQSVMAALAFPAESSLIESNPYSTLFDEEKWHELAQEFFTTHHHVFSMHIPSSLHIIIQAGMAVLNTRTCRRIRARKSELKLQNHVFIKSSDKEKNTSSIPKDTDQSLSANITEHIHGEDSHSEDESSDASDNNEISVSSSRRSRQSRKKQKISFDFNDKIKSIMDVDNMEWNELVRIGRSCPMCSSKGSQLCTKLPVSHHVRSRLICRVTKKVMDENNPPQILPNGIVYSKDAIDKLPSRDGLIQCIVTGKQYRVSDIQPLFII